MKTYIAIGFKAGDENLYRYVKNNPRNHVDPSGLRDPFAPRGTSRGHRGRPTLMRDGSVPTISSNIHPGVLQQRQNEGRLDFSNIDPYNPPNKLWGGIPAQQIPDSRYKNWREELDRQGDEEARRYREENREQIRRQEEEARKREEEIERLVDEKIRELRNKYWGTRQEFRNRIDHMNQLIKSIQNIKNLIAKYIKSKPDGCDRDDPKLVYYFERMEFYSKKYLEEYIEVANYIMSGNASTEDMLIEATKLDTLGTVGLQALQPPQIVDLQKQAIKSVGLQAKRTQRNCEYAQNTIDCANLALALYGVGQVTTTVAREGSKATIKITTSSLAGYAAAEGADMTMDALGFDIETKEKVFIGINIATLFLAWRNARCARKRSTTKTDDGSVEGKEYIPGEKPDKGEPIGSGGEGTVYEIPDDPSNVVKEFHPNSGPFKARNEYENLEKARKILPDNVVQAQPPKDVRNQNWIIKEKVFEVEVPDEARNELRNITTPLVNGGVNDVLSNMRYGYTSSNSTLRWILIE